MEGHLKKLHKAIESMIGHRKDLANTSTNLANSIAMLGKYTVQLAEQLKILAKIMGNIVCINTKFRE